MYESPIEKMVGEIQSQIIKQDDENIMYAVKKAVGYSVDKNELIKALKYDREQYEKGYRDGLNADKWTPVNEPPKENGKYLVTRKLSKAFDLDIIDVLSFNHNLFEVDKYEFAGEERAGWYDYDGEWGYFEINDVTAWMPLPKPYKAESEDKE